MPFAGKPIIGIVGGIASGKSYVSRTLAALGCCVIDSDAVAHAIYRQPHVVQTLREWYGPSVLDAAGNVDRRAVGAIVFRDPAQRKRLESLVHPLIHADRDATMQKYASDPRVRGFVWDSPLLIEAGLHKDCDCILFVDTPPEVRLARVRTTRGWDAGEFERRERNQLPLEQKRSFATDVVDGTLDTNSMRDRLESILKRLESRIRT